MNCPKCNKRGKSLSQIQIEETKYTESTGSVSMSGVGLGGGGLGIGFGSGSLSMKGTELSGKAKEFTPPKKPQMGMMAFGVIVFSGFMCFVLQALPTLPNLIGVAAPINSDDITPIEQMGSFIIDRLFPILIPIMIILTIIWAVITFKKYSKKENQEFDEAIAEYKNDLRKWENLYCKR